MKSTKVLNLLIVSLGVLASACNSTNGNADSILPPNNGREPVMSITGYMNRYFTFGNEINGAYTFIPTFEVVEQIEDNYVVDYCFRFLDYDSFDTTKDYLMNHFNVDTWPTTAFYMASSDKKEHYAKSEDDFIFDYDNLFFKIKIEQNILPRKGEYFWFNASPDNVCDDEFIFCGFKIIII